MEFLNKDDLLNKLNEQDVSIVDGIEATKSEKRKNKINIKKYSANGKTSLHESIVLNRISKFVTLDNNNAVFKDNIKLEDGGVLIPNDTFHTSNPLPYIFNCKEEFGNYLELASRETLDTLYKRVNLIYKKYVNMEDHYYPLLVGDTIWSYFQDKFGYTHYIIIVGDNGSGKNSALLVFKYLGYRVFYVTSASAANYYTQLGNIEEGQCTIAEDEAEDLAQDKNKRNVIKTGYCSGGSIPKVDLEGGRSQENWITYCHKWYAMEELSDSKLMKGVLDRSLVLKFVVGDIDYNIKDVIRSSGDPQYTPLYEELIHTRRLLFCYRLLHFQDPILDVKLNIKNRSAELTKPLIRLFQNSPTAIEQILDSLSKFMVERNEVKNNSFESRLYDAVTQLQAELDEPKEELTFTNEQIREKLKGLVDGHTLPDKINSFYSPEVGEVTQTKITKIARSKFKAQTPRLEINGKTARCLRFNKSNLNRIKSNYQIPDRIEILTDQTLPTLNDGLDQKIIDGMESQRNINYQTVVRLNVLRQPCE